MSTRSHPRLLPHSRIAAALLATTLTGTAQATCVADEAAPAGLQAYTGLIHAHTKYSDGDVNSLPADVFHAARQAGLDFAISTDHSDTLNHLLFLTVSNDCLDSLGILLGCLLPDHGDLDRWQQTGLQADAATDANFTAVRGFEWTSDRYGHINVAFSSGYTNAKLDGGYTDLQNFWTWLGSEPVPANQHVGGRDGVAIFNHPDDKKLSDSDPGRDWNQLAYVPAADAQMVGMELYNSGGRGTDVDAGRHDHYLDFYLLALANGWHVGAIGGEDMHDATWADASHAKTVLLATGRSRAALLAAMRARRMIALEANVPARALRVEFTGDGAPLGTRLACDAGDTVDLQASVQHADGTPFSGRLSLYDRAGQSDALNTALNRLPPAPPRAEQVGSQLQLRVAPPASGEDWYVLRVDDADGHSLAYTSPIWIRRR